jgi:Putative Ig domain
MRAYFARRRRLCGGLRPQSSAPTRQDRRRSSTRAALVSRWCTLVIAFFPIVSPVPLAAQETITYTYDALGRLVQVNHGTSGPSANVVASYTYDKADNRCNLTVSTTGAGGTGACASAGGTTALTVSPTTLPNGTVGTAYSQTITATGGTSPYTFAVSGGTLPAGLTLTSGGVLSGTPTIAATSSFTIKATDTASNTGSQAYSVTIGVQPPTPVNDAGSQGICTTNTYDVTANDTDPGGNLPLSVTAVSGVGFALVTGDPTSVQFSSTQSAGNKVGTYTVQNTKGATATATLTVSVVGGGVCQ